MKRYPELLTFSKEPVLASVLVAAIMRYQNLPYSRHETWINPVVDSFGSPIGFANCYGILLQAYKDVGLWDGDPCLHPATYGGQTQAKSLAEILEYNFIRVPKEEMRIGDVLSFRYRDVDPSLREPHHVGMLTYCHLRPAGDKFIEQWDFFHASEDAGKCIVSRVDALIDYRIDEILRLPQIVEG